MSDTEPEPPPSAHNAFLFLRAAVLALVKLLGPSGTAALLEHIAARVRAGENFPELEEP